MSAIEYFLSSGAPARSEAMTTRSGGVGPMKLGHVAFFAPDPNRIAEFYQRILGFRISDWIGDFFVFLRCNSDHHSVRLRIAGQRKHCELMRCTGEVQHPTYLGSLRFGPGHNVAVFHRDHDGQVVEFYAELDQMNDEKLGYYEPRPWHRDKPQRLKVWKSDGGIIWGSPVPAGFM
jgi:catechol 2,3-dioxygenase-like lactoylglutathione lyase family enzyme